MEADSSSRCGPAPDSSSTTAMAPSPTSHLRPWSTEAGVGILSAVTDPAAARLRIAEPVRSTARVILEASPGLCCRGYNCSILRCSSRNPPVSADELLLTCNLCRHWIVGGPIYVYKGELGFCEAGCRYDYVMQELGLRRAEAAAAAAKRARRRRAAVPCANEGGRMFFTCVEIP